MILSKPPPPELLGSLPDTGQDLAREVRSHYILDFSNWKNHDATEAEFAKLQTALQDATTRHRK